MLIYELEQGKITIYSDLDPNKADPKDIAADYTKINKILEDLKPGINIVMLPEVNTKCL